MTELTGPANSDKGRQDAADVLLPVFGDQKSTHQSMQRQAVDMNDDDAKLYLTRKPSFVVLLGSRPNEFRSRAVLRRRQQHRHADALCL